MTSVSFEWIGGRFKLVDSEPVSLLTGALFDSDAKENQKQDEMRSESKRQKRQVKRRVQRRKLENFLEEHHFDDVNAIALSPKTSMITSCLGLTSYQRPLHKAVKEKDVEIITLLLKYGADPMRKDSKRKTAFDYVKSQRLRIHMETLHRQSLAECAGDCDMLS